MTCKSLLRLLTLLCLLAGQLESLGQDTKTFLLLSSSDAIAVVNGKDTIPTKKSSPTAVQLNEGQHFLQFFELNGPGVLDTIIEVNEFRQEILKFDFKAPQEVRIIEQRDILIKGSLISNADVSPENSLAYSFVRGDKIELEIHMQNDKGNNFLSIVSYPDGKTVFSARKFQDLHDSFIVPADGIYVFQMSSNHAFDRQAKIKISRTPSEGTRPEHNTHVIWQTYYEAVSIHDAQSFHINSGSNALLMDGKSRVTLPITLPPNTKKWYYEFGAFREEADAANAKEVFGLASQISSIADPTGLLSIGIDMFTQPPGADICDLYLLDNLNSNRFIQKDGFTYIPNASRENYKSGIVEVDSDLGNSTYYLGIKNPSSTYGIHVILDVVAIVEKGSWVKVP